jgi:hypothetical protein
VPAGRVARVVFGLLVAVASTLLLAPQVTEFDAKVGLLASLAVVCAARPLLDRFLPEPRSADDSIGRFVTRFATGGGRGVALGAARIGLAGAAVVLLGVGIVAAGTPARGLVVSDASDVLGRVPHEIDPSTFPSVSLEPDVRDWNHELEGPGAQELVLTLAENLELENQALLRADETILAAVDHGDRLAEMQRRLRTAVATGTIVIAHHRFDALHLTLLQPFGVQTGLSLGVEAHGTVTEETYDAAGNLQARQASPFAGTFVMRRATGSRWLTVAVLPAQAGG